MNSTMVFWNPLAANRWRQIVGGSRFNNHDSLDHHHYHCHCHWPIITGPSPFWFRELRAGEFRANTRVENNVMAEPRSLRALESASHAQSLDWRKTGGGEAGLLPDFGSAWQLRRLRWNRTPRKIRGNPRKSPRTLP
jgi:hypothetical protein